MLRLSHLSFLSPPRRLHERSKLEWFKKFKTDFQSGGESSHTPGVSTVQFIILKYHSSLVNTGGYCLWPLCFLILYKSYKSFKSVATNNPLLFNYLLINIKYYWSNYLAVGLSPSWVMCGEERRLRRLIIIKTRETSTLILIMWVKVF